MYEVVSIFSHTNKKKKKQSRNSAKIIKNTEERTNTSESKIKASYYPKSLLPSELEMKPSQPLIEIKRSRVFQSPKSIVIRKSSNREALGLHCSQIIPDMMKTPRKERSVASRHSVRKSPKAGASCNKSFVYKDTKHMFQPFKITTKNISFLSNKYQKSPKISKSISLFTT